ncbi:spore germination protein GerPB [Neobacillus fumarioli]|uniref:spore germination protein GerPB n=1 Tax=Neobacillus fumarioli TaxID=105229 RepID=UPI0008315221|nr:spore germination protein GerPB [Neobacillus fumarioli]
MNFYIQQTIHINFMKIGGLTNSSVLQIGSAGIIKPAAYLADTGGFIKPAPEAIKPGELHGEMPTSHMMAPSVPIQAPVR